jgi:hypothetical protein
MKNFKLILIVSGLIILSLFTILVYLQGYTGAEYMINADEVALKNIFFGPKPFIHYCNPEDSEEVVLPPKLIAAYKNIGSNTHGLSAINCSQYLPSGKTILDRFKLKKEWKPIIFTTAPWTKPMQLTPISMKNSTTIEKFILLYTEAKPILVTSDKEYRDSCKFNHTYNNICVVVMKGTRFTYDNEIIINKFVETFPLIRTIIVDAKHRKFSYENPPVLPSNYAMKFHLIKNASSYHIYNKSPVLDNIIELGNNIMQNNANIDFKNGKQNDVSLVKTVRTERTAKNRKTNEEDIYDDEEDGDDDSTLRMNEKSKSDSKKQESKSKASEAKKEGTTFPSSSATDETHANKEKDKDNMRTNLEKERSRREEMERQQKEYLFEANDEIIDENSNIESNDDSYEDEEDEDIIEL